MRKGYVLLLLLVLIVSGCAHWISEQSRMLADTTITFSQLREGPDHYRGRFVLLGGVVATVTRTSAGTRLEVVEHRLDSRELPDQVVPSRGRFVATTPDSLDPATFKPGALVSMMGEVAGKESPLPVVAIREIHAIELPEVHPEYYYGDRHHFIHAY